MSKRIGWARLLATVVVSAAAGAGAIREARADEPLKGRVYVGLERATGFSYTTVSGTSDGLAGGGSTAKTANLNFFGVATSYAEAGTPVSFGSPRLAIDVNVLESLTVGVAAYVSWTSLATGSSDAEHLVGFGIAPRVGVTVPIADRVLSGGEPA